MSACTQDLVARLRDAWFYNTEADALFIDAAAEIERLAAENRRYAAAISWLAHNVAEDAGGCPDWYHDARCPQDDTCHCVHPEIIAEACRLVGPPYLAGARAEETDD